MRRETSLPLELRSAGRSLQEYLRAQLIELARRPIPVASDSQRTRPQKAHREQAPSQLGTGAPGR